MLAVKADTDVQLRITLLVSEIYSFCQNFQSGFLTQQESFNLESINNSVCTQ